METHKKFIEKIEGGKKITRKQAIKKAGVTALAASSLLLLNTQANACASHIGGGKVKGNNGWGNGDQPAPGNSGPHNNAENGPKSGQGNSGNGKDRDKDRDRDRDKNK